MIEANLFVENSYNVVRFFYSCMNFLFFERRYFHIAPEKVGLNPGRCLLRVIQLTRACLEFLGLRYWLQLWLGVDIAV